MNKYQSYLLSEEARDITLGHKKKRPPTKSSKNEQLFGYLFVLIPIIGFSIFVLYPTITSIITSFTDYQLFSESLFTSNWVWLDNYVQLFKTKEFWNALLNTIVLLVSIPIGITLGLLVATYINRASHGSKLLSLFYYLPAVTSAVAISIVFNYMFDYSYGIFHNFFCIDIFWFDANDFFLAKIAILTKGIWGGIGGTTILFLAGLNGIPHEYYEASTIDGATPFQQFMYITVPMVHPTLFYLVLTQVISHLQAYADAKLFTNGGQGTTVVYYIWEKLYPTGNYGLMTAATTFIAIIILVITVIQFKRSKMFDI